MIPSGAGHSFIWCNFNSALGIVWVLSFCQVTLWQGSKRDRSATPDRRGQKKGEIQSGRAAWLLCTGPSAFMSWSRFWSSFPLLINVVDFILVWRSPWDSFSFCSHVLICKDCFYKMLVITTPVIKPTVENPFCSHHQQIWECPDAWLVGGQHCRKIPHLWQLLLHRGSWNVNFLLLLCLWNNFTVLQILQKWREEERRGHFFTLRDFETWLLFGGKVFKHSLVNPTAPLLHCL